MEDLEVKYNGEFTIEQRKAMTAEMLKELRKAKKLSQKEVAGHLNIPATTYNTYESGRTEPPIEILVRLSYLYAVPVDFIVQKDRTYRTTDELVNQLEVFSKQMKDKTQDAPDVNEVIGVISKLVDAMTMFSQNEAVKEAVNISEDD